MWVTTRPWPGFGLRPRKPTGDTAGPWRRDLGLVYLVVAVSTGARDHGNRFRAADRLWVFRSAVDLATRRNGILTFRPVAPNDVANTQKSLTATLLALEAALRGAPLEQILTQWRRVLADVQSDRESQWRPRATTIAVAAVCGIALILMAIAIWYTVIR